MNVIIENKLKGAKNFVRSGVALIAKGNSHMKLTAKQIAANKAKALGSAKTAKAVKVKSANYRTSKEMFSAFLFNVRKNDCVFEKSAKIKKGQIVQGIHGFCIAQNDVQGVKAANIVAFKANGKLAFKNDAKETKFVCMHLNGANYAVYKTATGKFANAELDTFDGQTKKNRSYLV